MIECKGIFCRSGKKVILDDASVLAPDGEITVIVGKNGSGKTTLFRQIFSTRGRGCRGKVYVDGKDVREISRKEFSRSVALMPQDLPSPKISVRELILLGRSPYSGAFGHLTDEDRRAALAAAEALGLSAHLDSQIPTLSGGERQNAYFAMLLAKNAKNILLDEPAASLDAPCRARLASFVRGLKSEGKCVVLIMHDLTDAIALADKIYVMEDGKTSAALAPDEFLRSDVPRRVFLSVPYKVNTEGGEIFVFRPIEKT